MTTEAIIMMILVLTFFWGGFIWAIVRLKNMSTEQNSGK